MKPIKAPNVELQVGFYWRLESLRDTLLLKALKEQVRKMRVASLDEQLRQFVAEPTLAKVASWGMRGELIFAIPELLRNKPCLLGYYRLLLGLSQKEFYGSNWGLGPFKSMEDRDYLSNKNEERLQELCEALCKSGAYLCDNVSDLSQSNLHELTLLTLGPQLRGGLLNRKGSEATREVFELIRDVIAPRLKTSSDTILELTNAAGRTVVVEFAADPDVCIREKLPSGNLRNMLAIEIKGGRDVSNIHNRIGEAEKSHQKAKKENFREFWTIVGVSSLDKDLVRRESPTTDRFFLLEDLRDQANKHREEFVEAIVSLVGIRVH